MGIERIEEEIRYTKVFLLAHLDFHPHLPGITLRYMDPDFDIGHVASRDLTNDEYAELITLLEKFRASGEWEVR